jgi:hypothetical protein
MLEESKLAIFGNMRIDSQERLLRLKDSFQSFGDATRYDWYLRFRGEYGSQAREFLEDMRTDGARIEFPKADSSGRWLVDSLQMAEVIQSQYVLLWMEDHLCVGGQELLDQVVADMQQDRVDLLLYSFFFDGETLRSYAEIPSTDAVSLIVVDYDQVLHAERLATVAEKAMNAPTYIVSFASIMKLELFRRILSNPVSRSSRWPKDAPYDFEQPPDATGWLPLRVGVLKSELFASIDDDHGQPGYCLISRGLYPSRVAGRITGAIPSHALSYGGVRSLMGRALSKMRSNP